MYFYLYKDTRGEWRWSFNAANHKKVADSGEGYINRQDAINGINLVRNNAASSKILDATTSTYVN